MTDFTRMRAIANLICDIVEKKDKDYGSSWRRRGGPGAFMVTVRKTDRIETLAKRHNYDIFEALKQNTGGIEDDIRDLIGYALLILEHAGSNVELKDKPVVSAPAEQVSPFDFPKQIARFNWMFSLPQPLRPQMYIEERNINALGRLYEFKKILQDELDEVNQIIGKVAGGGDPLEILTDLADWLGDIQVYCASEMARWGIPWEGTMRRIMDAQWSKLDENGQPIVKDGKVQKGPNYVPPEPAIRSMLETLMYEDKSDAVAVYTDEGAEMVRRAELLTQLGQHEDETFQCEGFYGDGTQLYRHRTDRNWIRRHKSLVDAHVAYAASKLANHPV